MSARGKQEKRLILKGDWRNAAGDPLIRAAGIPIVESWNESAVLWRAHRDNGQGYECTHFCHPSAPQAWVHSLFRALRDARDVP